MIRREEQERVILFFSQGRYQEEFVRARESFFFITGRVYDDDPFFEERQNAFCDWYIMDRRLEANGLTPLRQYYETFEGKMGAEQAAVYQSLLQSVHSLFEVVEKSNQAMKMKDSFDGRIFSVRERRSLVGLQNGDLLDTRLIPTAGHYQLSETYCHHPREARAIILEMIKKNPCQERRQFQSFLLELSGMQLKSRQYRQVALDKIYQRSPLGREV